MILHFDIGLAPLIFFKLMVSQYVSPCIKGSAKILKCKLFRQRIELSSQVKWLQINQDALKKREEETRMKNEQLESDNAALSEEVRNLKEQIAMLKLKAQGLTDLETNNSEAEQTDGLIKERSRMRATHKAREEMKCKVK